MVRDQNAFEDDILRQYNAERVARRNRLRKLQEKAARERTHSYTDYLTFVLEII